MLRRYRAAASTLRGIKNMAGPFVKGQQCGQRCAPRWDKLQPDSKSLAVAASVGGSYTVEPGPGPDDAFQVMNSGTQTHNISGQAHPVSISIQPGFALLDKADSSSQPRSEASSFHHFPCFCSSAEATCAFGDFTLFACLPVEKCKYPFILRITFHGILFCKTKIYIYIYMYPPSKTHSIRPSSTLFICLSVYLSGRLYLTLHVRVLVFSACWFIAYLIWWRRGIYMWKLHVCRCGLAPLWGLSMEEWRQGEPTLRVHTREIYRYSALKNANELRLITWYQAEGDTRKHLCSSQDGTSS